MISKRLSKKTLIVLLVCLVALVSAVGAPLLPEEDESTNVVGVEVGDWVKYSFLRTEWYPPGPKDWVKVEVENISGTNVTVRETIGLSDGSQITSIISGDILIEPVGNYYIIAANLSAGDKVLMDRVVWINSTYTRKAVELLINATVSRSYDGLTREVNVLNWSYLMPEFGQVESRSEEYYWDKETGFLLEMRWKSESLGIRRSIQITDTNMWEMGENSPLWRQDHLWIAVALTAVTIFTIAFKKRHTIRSALKNEKD